MVPVVNWTGDRRGAVAVQAMLVIAICIVVVYMGFEIWKVISIKQSVHAAAYQAAKWIALNGLKCLNARCEYGLTGYVQRFIVEPEVRSNVFVPEADPLVIIHVDYDPYDYCDNPFRVTVLLRHSVLVPPRFGQGGATDLALTLSRTIRGELACAP